MAETGELTMTNDIGYLIALSNYLREAEDGDDITLSTTDTALCAEALRYKVSSLGRRLALKAALGAVAGAMGLTALLQFAWA
jgi:hypothetical protein